MTKKNFFLFLLFFYQLNIFSQYNFYQTDTVREIKIYFYESDWDNILDSLYVMGNNNRILADVIIDGFSYDSVGIRYKGFSSASVNRIKNPFNIKLDFVKNNQNHFGYDKIKLSNCYKDPSFIREVLSYEISRKYMPSPQANFINVIINDTLWGLYTNVESINNDFLVKHFNSKYNTFVKCNPKNINIQIGAENSSLSNAHGNDSLNYEPYYSMKSENGWSELYNLIDTLNNYPGSLLNLLNIDRTLWMHALNYSIINFDSYIGYAQNYYIYRDDSKQFNPIMWDFNMSFGGFRLTDASQLYYNGFNITQAQEMDPLVHSNFVSVAPRPLIRNLFSNDRHKKMYLAHIRTIIQENIHNQNYYSRAQSLYNLIDSHVQNDTNKFYSYTDFIDNLNNQVTLPTFICPGITQLMNGRYNYLINYLGYTGHPTIINHNISQITNLGEDLIITAEVNNASFVSLNYRFGDNQIFKTIEMLDDGMNNDGNANDGIYGAKIINCANSTEYYFYAENDSTGYFYPERAAYEFFSYSLNLNPGDLVINELMSNNNSTVFDDNGDYEDWIELFNTTNFPISTKGLYLTDTISHLQQWELPNYIIHPNSYFVIWADNDENQGSIHSNFKLSNLGEKIILSNADSSVIDSVSFITQLEDISFARNPNGIGLFEMMLPTFNKNNNSILSNNDILNDLNYFPNPFNDKLRINTSSSFYIYDLFGRVILELESGPDIIDTSRWKSGIYFLYLKKDNITHKLIKI